MIGRLQVAKYLYASINANGHVLLDVDAECLFIIIMLTPKMTVYLDQVFRPVLTSATLMIVNTRSVIKYNNKNAC